MSKTKLIVIKRSHKKYCKFCNSTYLNIKRHYNTKKHQKTFLNFQESSWNKTALITENFYLRDIIKSYEDVTLKLNEIKANVFDYNKKLAVLYTEYWEKLNNTNILKCCEEIKVNWMKINNLDLKTQEPSYGCVKNDKVEEIIKILNIKKTKEKKLYAKCVLKDGDIVYIDYKNIKLENPLLLLDFYERDNNEEEQEMGLLEELD